MSIHLVPESERSPGVGLSLPFNCPPPGCPMRARANRLQHLAQGHAMAEYLLWAAELAGAQQATAEALPLPEQEAAGLGAALQQHTQTPLHSAHGLARPTGWPCSTSC